MKGANTNLLGLDRRELERFFVAMGEKPYRACQVMKWIYHHGVADFDAMTDLSLALRTGPRCYDIHFESLSEHKRVPAAERALALQSLMETFAKRLEYYCAREPFQWFNFYDYWAEEIDVAN